MWQQAHGYVSGCCQSQWEPGAVTAPSSVPAAPGRCEPWEAQGSLWAKPAHHLPPSGDPVIAGVTWQQIQGCSERERAGKVKGLFVFPTLLLRSSHRVSEDHTDLLLLLPAVGVIPGTAGPTRANALVVSLGLAAAFGPQQWCQDDTKVVPVESSHRGGLVVPQERVTHPEQATCILVLADVEPPPDVLCSADGSSQLCWVLSKVSKVSRHPLCWESDSLPCLPLPLEHLVWPNIHWSHMWQVCSIEFLVSLQQEFGCNMDKAREHGRHRFCLFVCCFQHVNVNKPSSNLGNYWLRFFLHIILQYSKYSNGWNRSMSFHLHAAGPFHLFSTELLETSKCYQYPCQNIFYSTFLDPLTSTKHWRALMAPSQLSVLCAFLSALRHEPRANHTSLLDWLHSTNWHRMKFRAGNRETLAFSMNRLQISVTAVKVNWDWKLFYCRHVSWMFPFFGKYPGLASEEWRGCIRKESTWALIRSGPLNFQAAVKLLNWEVFKTSQILHGREQINYSLVSCKSGTSGAKPG